MVYKLFLFIFSIEIVMVKEYFYPLLKRKKKEVLHPYVSPIFLATFKMGCFSLEWQGKRTCLPIRTHRSSIVIIIKRVPFKRKIPN